MGKSTLIRRLLAESILPVGGFVTRRLPQADGDGMFPIYLHAAALPPEERPYDPEHLVGTCDSRRSVRYPEAFDRLGPPLLTSGGLLVMDELGFLENDAHRFQAAVLAALDGNGVYEMNTWSSEIEEPAHPADRPCRYMVRAEGAQTEHPLFASLVPSEGGFSALTHQCSRKELTALLEQIGRQAKVCSVFRKMEE